MEPRLTNPFGQHHQAEPAAPQQPSTAPSPPAGAPAPPAWPPAGETWASVTPLHGTTENLPAVHQEPPALIVPAAAPRRPAGELVRRWYGAAVATGQHAVTGNAVMREQLPSIAGLWREMAAADWAPEDAKVLRFTGRAYRLVIAIPASLVAYAGLWIIQRPLRLFLAIAITAIATVFIVIL